MGNRALLSRIDSASDGEPIRRHASASQIANCVVQNLSQLMQMRQGKAQSAPACGLPDFSDWFLTYSNPGPRLCAAIEQMVRDFEPRLRAVSVSELEEREPGELRFEIRAQLVLGDGQLQPFRAHSLMRRADYFTVVSV
ncbi:MAG: type VI secretion system baseplate subunit TssE [Pseudomonadota bacterium]